MCWVLPAALAVVQRSGNLGAKTELESPVTAAYSKKINPTKGRKHHGIKTDA